MSDLLSTAQVADIVGVGPDRIGQLARSGELPFVHKSPGRTGTYIFDAVVVRMWMIQHRKSRRTQQGERRRRRDQLEVTAS